MKTELIRIEIEFERPGSHSLEECVKLVLHQMRAKPIWDEPAGTGHLNYVCYDKKLRTVGARILEAA